MKPIEWYQGKCDPSEYIEMFGDKWIDEYPQKPELMYYIINVDDDSAPKEVLTWAKLVKKGLNHAIITSIKSKESVWIDDSSYLVKRQLPKDIETYDQQKQLYNAQYQALENKFKEDLCEHFLMHKQLSNICFRMAWDRGHSDGLHEVYNIYGDLADDLDTVFNIGFEHGKDFDTLRGGTPK